MTNKQLFEPINLDGLSIDAADFLDAAQVFGIWAVYAESKGYAMRYRLSGDIEAALSHEKAADVAYNCLPQWARW